MTIDKDKRIRELEETVRKLLARIDELERKLAVNSGNSSMPPSSDKPGNKASAKDKTCSRKKKRGAKCGHKKQNKALLPEDQVTKLVELLPEFCPSCGKTTFQDCGEEPYRAQFIDLPQIKPEVIEIRRPVLACAACGQTVCENLPRNTPGHTFGPGVVAMVGVLTGLLNISKRKAHLMMTEIFNVPMSLGAVSACEKRLADSLEQPYEETLAAARSGTFAHADETGWPLGNQHKGWLWVLSNDNAAAFMVHKKRGQVAAQRLLDNFSGTLVSDRWGGYNMYEGHRQICWAHLRRDFKAVSESGGWLGKTGKKLHDLSGKILGDYGRVRNNTLRLETFQRRISKWRRQLENWLRQGAKHGGELSAKCREILKCGEMLWTFVYAADVEPTNNQAERDVRQGVLWRKGSFGVQSEDGARYVERVLSIGATCRRQSKSVIEYFKSACTNFHNKSPIPSLFG